ncbi:unnamed protein product [Sphagnum jensenii]|jgi:hypothetical protein|uniref:Uncharacterized protein n=1 Tax=Sphagnum jensenii TaxID=128206 RepID=A0ABP0X6Y1_9BRYO
MEDVPCYSIHCDEYVVVQACEGYLSMLPIHFKSFANLGVSRKLQENQKFITWMVSIEHRQFQGHAGPIYMQNSLHFLSEVNTEIHGRNISGGNTCAWKSNIFKELGSVIWI